MIYEAISVSGLTLSVFSWLLNGRRRDHLVSVIINCSSVSLRLEALRPNDRV